MLNQEWFTPIDDTPESACAVDISNGIHNDWFLGGIFQVAYPQIVLDGLAVHLPNGWQDEMPIISTPVDWLGVNYYSQEIMSANRLPGAMWPKVTYHQGSLPRTQMGWKIYSEGLYQKLKRIAGS